MSAGGDRTGDHGGVLCRDCGFERRGPDAAARACPDCRSPRLVRAADLFSLSIAHVDCDAFYASVEKRDDPSLAHRPVIVGGGRRGVVSAACYLARQYGVRSAMPMFKALAACPDAVVRRPRMDAYVAASREIRRLFQNLSPLVEPLSLDEAFLDLGGTEALHGRTPAALLAGLARQVEREVGVSISIGLAPNKFLAKLGSTLDKPRGFTVISAAGAAERLAPMPISRLWGVGAAMAARLQRDGYHLIGDLQRADAARLTARYGALGARLAQLAQGQDARRVDPTAQRKSVSSETTFAEDTRDGDVLDARLWRACERVADQLKGQELSAGAVVLKLKTARFELLTRRRALGEPTSLADGLYQEAAPLLQAAVAETSRAETTFRLIGIAAADLRHDGARLSTSATLFDRSAPARAGAELAIDAIRKRFGNKVIHKGRAIE